LLVGLVALRDPLCQLAPSLSLCPSPIVASNGTSNATSEANATSEPAASNAATVNPAADDVAAGEAAANAGTTQATGAPASSVSLTVRVRRKGAIVDGALVSAGRHQCATVAGACTLQVALSGTDSLRLEATKGDGAGTLSGALDVPVSELTGAEPSVTLELERGAGLRQDVVVRVWRGRAGRIQTDDVTVQVVGGTDQQQCSTRDRGSCTLPQVDTDRSGSLELQVVAGKWSGIAQRSFEELQSDPRMEIVLTDPAGSTPPQRVTPCLTKARVQKAMESCLHRPGRHVVSVRARPGTAPQIQGAGPYEACLSQALGPVAHNCRAASVGPVTIVR